MMDYVVLEQKGFNIKPPEDIILKPTKEIRKFIDDGFGTKEKPFTKLQLKIIRKFINNATK